MKFWPSAAFWRGFRSAFTLFPEPRRHFDCGVSTFTVSTSAEEAERLNAEALQGDFVAVGRDLWDAIDKTKKPE